MSPNSAPFPAGDCPTCGTLMFVRLTSQPTLPMAKPAGPGDPCSLCPYCGAQLWVILQARPPLARPVDRTLTALIPKNQTKRLAPTEILPKADP